MARVLKVEAKIEGLEAKIEGLEAKIERLEQSYPADERPAGLAVELEQYRKNMNTLQEELVELLKYRNILLTKEAAVQAQVAAEPAYNLLQWGYKNVAVNIISRSSHTRLYDGDCELVKLPLDQFCPIVKAKMCDVTSNVTMPGDVAKRMRNFAADVEAQSNGKKFPLTAEVQLNTRFEAVVGSGVAEVVNICILQKQPTWSQLSFQAEARPSKSLCRPDFLIKQNGVDVCGGEGKMPSVMNLAFDLLTEPCAAASDALMQACSYCKEKKWRFTFITYYYFTFFLWRVAEDRYAVTEGFFNDDALYDLHVREALAYIIWMSLEAPWGSQLPEEDDGALQALEAQLRQQAAKEVLRGKPKEHSKKYNEDPSEPSQVLDKQHWLSGSNRRQETPAAPLTPSKDQLASGGPVQDAPEYPLASLQLSSICLGGGQCGSVMQGWLWGVPVAVKGTDACKSPDIVELLWHEAQIYDVLKDLQGHLLPILHGSGFWMGHNNFFLATSVVAGKPISNCSDVTGAQAVAQAARQALQAIHERGVAHGDVRADNFLVQHRGSQPQVYIIDFGHAYLNPTPEQCERELEELSEVLEANGMAGAQPSCTPPEAETIQLGIPAMLHGDETKLFYFTHDGEESFQLTSDKKIAGHEVVVMGKDKAYVGPLKTHTKVAKPVKSVNQARWFHHSGYAIKVMKRMGAAGRLLRF